MHACRGAVDVSALTQKCYQSKQQSCCTERFPHILCMFWMRFADA